MTIMIIATIVFVIGMIVWAKSMQSDNTNVSTVDDPDVLSTNGIHWHSKLEIYVKGVKQDIPSGLGLLGVHRPMHTHDDVPTIHLEFPARVTRNDTKLGNFFEVWGKNPSDFGQIVTMTVNGESKTELMDYQMKDGDQIELRYE